MTLIHSTLRLTSTHIIRTLVACVIAATLWGCGSTQIKDSASHSSQTSTLSSLSKQQLARFNSALSELKSEQPKAAEKKLKKLLSAQPDVVEIWVNLALSQYQQNKFKATQKTLNTLLQKTSDVPQAHNLLGLIAVERGSFKKAVNHYKKAIKLSPQYANAQYNMALLQDVYLQNIPLALRYYQNYSQIAPDDQQTKDWITHLQSSQAK